MRDDPDQQPAKHGNEGADRRSSAEPNAIGYRNPPAEHRFQKGRSGNPNGRPRKQKPQVQLPTGTHGPSERLGNQLLLEEAYRPVTIREGDKVIELPAIQAVFRSMNVSAMKGNRLAQKMVAELVANVEEEHRKQQQSYFEAVAEYKMDWEREFEALKKRGLPLPDPVPHPDDIHVDYRTGTVRIAGPFCPEEKATWDKSLERRAAAQEAVTNSSDRYKCSRNPRLKELYLDEWHSEQLMFDIINDAMPERYKATLENRSYRESASRPGKASEIMAEKRRWMKNRGYS
jgi:hypothetical protein